MKSKIYLIIILLIFVVGGASAVNVYFGNNTTIFGRMTAGDYFGISYWTNISGIPFTFPNSTITAENLAAWNATYNSTYDITTIIVNGNLTNWNSTYNASYLTSTYNSTYDQTTLTVNGNLGNWNSTYNATYDGFLSMINSLQENDTQDRTYVNNTFIKISTYNGDFPNSTVANNLQNWNSTYNSTYANMIKTDTVEFFSGDGISKNFSVIQIIYPNSSQVSINGIIQRRWDSYIENTNSVNFTWTPRNGDKIDVKYKY